MNKMDEIILAFESGSPIDYTKVDPELGDIIRYGASNAMGFVPALDVDESSILTTYMHAIQGLGAYRRGDIEEDNSFKQLGSACLIINAVTSDDEYETLELIALKTTKESTIQDKYTLIQGHMAPPEEGEQIRFFDHIIKETYREMDEEVIVEGSDKSLSELIEESENEKLPLGFIVDFSDAIGERHIGFVTLIALEDFKYMDKIVSSPEEAHKHEVVRVPMNELIKSEEISLNADNWLRIAVRAFVEKSKAAAALDIQGFEPEISVEEQK